jgi:hypothetical protein
MHETFAKKRKRSGMPICKWLPSKQTRNEAIVRRKLDRRKDFCGRKVQPVVSISLNGPFESS